MAGSDPQRSALWKLARRQHGVLTREQLLGHGVTRHGIEHRVARGRLHRLHRGVFAVGRPDLTPEGRLLAAVLACGPESVISHHTAAQHWGLQVRRAGPIEISAPADLDRRPHGVLLHRRLSLQPGDRTMHAGVPVTTPIRTLVDIATQLGERNLEAAVNEADKRDLAHPEELRNALHKMARQPGAGRLRRLLDRQVFRLTDSELERMFLELVGSARLPRPETQRMINGFRVDFYWPEHGLVVETDGLRYHRTAAQQAQDRLRDQAHTAAGLTTMRFTHAQVRYEQDEVRQVLSAVIARLAGRRAAA